MSDGDLLTFDEIVNRCGEDLARRVLKHADHRGPDGRPAMTSGRLADVIGLLNREEQPS